MKKKKHFPKKLFQKNITKFIFIIFIIFLLPIIFWASQYPQLTSSEGKTVKEKVNYLSIANNSYGTIDPIDRYPANDPPAENHPDLNLSIRGFVPTNGEKYPLVLGEGGDPKAPQIWKMLSHRPTIVSLYRINSWDWKTNQKGPPMPLPDDPAASVKRVQMIGLETYPGEEILTPDSGYRIGGEYQVMVIYADENSITVKYGREDNIGIKFGYAIQVEEIEVNPDLLNLYRSLNAAGRSEVPALVGEQLMGTAKGTEIRVGIRDTGDFLDPRSKLDWWQGADYPSVPTDIVKNPTNPVQPTRVPTVNQPPPTTVPSPILILPSPTEIIIPSPTTNYQFASPSQGGPPTTNPVVVVIPPTTIPTSPPTPAPFINVGNTVNTARSLWERLVTNVIKFTRIILP